MSDQEQAVREAAYFIWKHEGCPEGRDLEHWKCAVAEIEQGLTRGFVSKHAHWGQRFGISRLIQNWRKKREEAKAEGPEVAPPLAGEPVASIRFDYFKNRLEHTLAFTHQATRNIYLVNGAVLAMTYFVAEHGARVNGSVQRLGPPLLLLVLWFVNLAHAGLLIYQGRWYRILDNGFAAAAGIGDRPAIRGWLGTHRIYVTLHTVIAFILLLVAIFLFFTPPTAYDSGLVTS